MDETSPRAAGGELLPAPPVRRAGFAGGVLENRDAAETTLCIALLPDPED